ncbi:MAG: hypothetical protein WBE72_23455 [Terracidiphilus sp.]
MRLNLELTETQMNSLKALQHRTGANTMKDLVNHALSMLEWAVDETAHGNEIAAVNEDESTYRVMVTPLLQHVAKQERQMPVSA